jgi:hypothetical protein
LGKRQIEWGPVKLDIIVRCPKCWKELQLGDLGTHAALDHGNDIEAREKLMDIGMDIINELVETIPGGWKGTNDLIREILYNNLEFQVIRSDEYHFIDSNSQEVYVIPTPSRAFVNANAIFYYSQSILNDFKKLKEINSGCKCLENLLENSYYHHYVGWHMFRPIGFLLTISIAGDAGGGLEGLALYARQLLEELELSLVLDLHRDFRDTILERKLEDHDNIMNNRGFIETKDLGVKRLSEYLKELLYDERLDNIKQIPDAVIRGCGNAYNLLSNVYKMLSEWIHSTTRTKIIRKETGAISHITFSSYWDSKQDLATMGYILEAVFDALVTAHHIWLRKFVSRAKERCKKVCDDVRSPWEGSDFVYIPLTLVRIIQPIHCYDLEIVVKRDEERSQNACRE